MKKTYTNSLIALFAVAGGASLASADPVESFFDEQFKSLEEAVPGKFNINMQSCCGPRW